MLIHKGTQVSMLCCNRRHTAQFDFTPKQPPLVCGNTIYLRGPCIVCKIKQMQPELESAGIEVK